jgi:hypothetical protein
MIHHQTYHTGVDHDRQSRTVTVVGVVMVDTMTDVFKVENVMLEHGFD